MSTGLGRLGKRTPFKPQLETNTLDKRFQTLVDVSAKLLGNPCLLRCAYLTPSKHGNAVSWRGTLGEISCRLRSLHERPTQLLNRPPCICICIVLSLGMCNASRGHHTPKKSEHFWRVCALSDMRATWYIGLRISLVPPLSAVSPRVKME